MTNNTIDLEDKVFYRLVKVFYFIFLAIFLLIIFFLGYNSIPTEYIDNEKSYLVCENGLYPFKEAGIHFWGSGNKFFSNDFDKDAKNACEKINSEYLRKKEFNAELEKQGQHYMEISKEKITREIARAELKRREMIRQPNHPAYELSVEYKKEGNWINVFYWWLVGSIVTYIVLNVIKNTLIYIVYGKKFSWIWLTKIYNYMKTIL